MALELLAIDLGKRSFHLYGIDTDGVILSTKVSRAKLAEVIGNLAPKTIAMEACASAHYWARCWLAAGRRGAPHQSSFRKALRQGLEERCGRRRGDLRSGDASDDALRAGKVDRPAGSAIAASCPRPADLPTDGVDQPYARPARRIRHRAAARPVAVSRPRPPPPSPMPSSLTWRERSSASCWTNSATSIAGSRSSTDDGEPLPDERPAGGSPSCRVSGRSSQRRSSPPSTTADSFARAGRWQPGSDLVPRQYTTGGKPRLGGIGRRANHYLRRQMIHGARAVMFRLSKHDDRRSLAESAGGPPRLQSDDCRPRQ